MKIRRTLLNGILVGTIISNAGQVFANDLQKTDNVLEKYDIETNAENSYALENDEEALCQKIEYDEDNDSTDLNDSLEKELNKVGIFDDDIELLSDDTIKDLNNAVSIYTDISYSYEDGTLMNAEDVDAIVEEKYKKEIEEEKSENTLFEKISKVLDFTPEAVEVDTINEKTGTGIDKGVMKQTIYILVVDDPFL